MSDTKTGVKEDLGLSGINNIIKIISSIFGKMDTPITPLPPQLLLTGATMRPGMSAKEMASTIISRQSEAGAPVGNLFSETNNIAESMEIIRCEVILNMLQTKAKIEVVIPPGIPVTTFGANAGGPVVCQGASTNLVQGWGVIR